MFHFHRLGYIVYIAPCTPRSRYCKILFIFFKCEGTLKKYRQNFGPKIETERIQGLCMVWRASLVVACFNNSADADNFNKCKYSYRYFST